MEESSGPEVRSDVYGICLSFIAIIVTLFLTRRFAPRAPDPRFLALTLMSSLATFYALPSYETATASKLLNSIRSTAGLSPSSGISLPTFERALVLNAELKEDLKSVLLPRLDQDIQLAIKTSPSVEEEVRSCEELDQGINNDYPKISLSRPPFSNSSLRSSARLLLLATGPHHLRSS